MGDCATQQTMRFETGAALALEAAFDGGMLTSDGGLPLLAEIDAELGVCESLAECGGKGLGLTLNPSQPSPAEKATEPATMSATLPMIPAPLLPFIRTVPLPTLPKRSSFGTREPSSPISDEQVG